MEASMSQKPDDLPLWNWTPQEQSESEGIKEFFGTKVDPIMSGTLHYALPPSSPKSEVVAHHYEEKETEKEKEKEEQKQKQKQMQKQEEEEEEEEEEETTILNPQDTTLCSSVTDTIETDDEKSKDTFKNNATDKHKHKHKLKHTSNDLETNTDSEYNAEDKILLHEMEV
ncbi:hypothetical protein RFI_19602 [Reticulomyxa filosa]|uniref:Uncharacterized protein n=1 Tax=Reticulomyxa filosa TaxID=46433 RepID=X6MV42_RETFI|nr:hypothetical protein RFI_19602 [Reticulomyxa filosa]|eukprot:ETO17714.1 hypothetical protein RFI_19602 [Reticulomyxa filosa]